MRAATVGLVAIVATWLVATPAAAIAPEFFLGYSSAGALVVRTTYPVGGSALVSVNFDPAHFSAAEANGLYLALRALVGGATIDSFSPAGVAAAGLSPVVVIQALQNFYRFGAPPEFREFWLLDVYRKQPSGIGIDVYRFFGPNNFQYTLTVGA